jgi:hypothetical protein
MTTDTGKGLCFCFNWMIKSIYNRVRCIVQDLDHYPKTKSSIFYHRMYGCLMLLSTIFQLYHGSMFVLVFKNYIKDVVMVTGAWIVTGGTNTGVMKHVGEAQSGKSCSLKLKICCF